MLLYLRVRMLEKAGESWRKLEKAGERWRKLEKAGESWRKLEKAGESWRKLEKAGESWRKLEKAGEGWRKLEKAGARADEGKDILNKAVKAWRVANHIGIYHTYGRGKSVVVERLNK